MSKMTTLFFFLYRTICCWSVVFALIYPAKRVIPASIYIYISYNYYKMQCFFVCVVSMESPTVQLTHMTFILTEPGWAWAGFSHSPIIRFDG